MIQFFLFIGLVGVTVYGLKNDFALGMIAWGAAVAVASSLTSWFGWAVVVLSVLALSIEGGGI